MARFLSTLAQASGEQGYSARARALLEALSTPRALDAQGQLLGEYLLALWQAGVRPAVASP